MRAKDRRAGAQGHVGKVWEHSTHPNDAPGTRKPWVDVLSISEALESLGVMLFNSILPLPNHDGGGVMIFSPL